MQQDTIQLVQDSWTKVAAIAPQAAGLFYQNLFLADPSLRPLFTGNMNQQGKVLMHMIGTAVGQLHHMSALGPSFARPRTTPYRVWGARLKL